MLGCGAISMAPSWQAFRKVAPSWPAFRIARENGDDQGDLIAQPGGAEVNRPSQAICNIIEPGGPEVNRPSQTIGNIIEADGPKVNRPNLVVEG